MKKVHVRTIFLIRRSVVHIYISEQDELYLGKIEAGQQSQKCTVRCKIKKFILTALTNDLHDFEPSTGFHSKFYGSG